MYYLIYIHLLKICSINNLLVPYGLVVPPVLHSSVIGITSGLPYTVAEVT